MRSREPSAKALGYFGDAFRQAAADSREWQRGFSATALG
jgi:hypothetical protein